jgi:hypothetical protein
MKTEMADKPNPKDTSKAATQPVASAKDRRLAGLKAREAGLKAKIEKRIPAFNAETREQSLDRAKTHLEQIQAEIKKASQ